MSAPPDPRALPPGRPDGGIRPRREGGVQAAEPARTQDFPGADEGLFLRDYWRIIRYRRWTVVLGFLAAVAAAAAFTLTTRPVYTAMATLRIEKDEPRVLTFEEVVRADPQEEYYQTQYGILQSRSLANRVIERLALERHPEFQDILAGRDAGRLTRARWWVEARIAGLLPGDRSGGAGGDAPDESPITWAFHERLRVLPVRGTRLVNVSFDSHDPDLAARVVNTLADTFIATSLEHKTSATRYATRFLGKQMEESRARLAEAEERLNRFLKTNDIHFLGPDGAGDRQDLTTRQLVQLSEALLRARADRIAKESTYTQAVMQDPSTLPAVLASPVIARLKEQLLVLEGEYRELGQVFRREARELRMRQLEEGILEMERRIDLETRRIVRSLEADFQTALRAEDRIEKAASRQRALSRRLGDQMVQYSLLRREVDTNRELFTSLLSRLKETGVSQALLTSNISVVDRAVRPRSPSRPRTVMNLLIAGVLGLLGGVGFAFVREHLDTTVRDVREVETALGVTALAAVPSLGAALSRRERRRSPAALAAHTRMASVFAEAFRTLRTSLLFSASDGPPRTVVITSIRLDDGKTSVATNLAVVLAQLGVGDVLLVDGDMRRPQLHRLLGVPQTPGFSTLLTGQAELADVVRPTRVPNLFVIPSGEVPPNPAELVSSARVPHVLDLVRRHFAHAVVDAPPLFGISDAMILAPQAEGVVLVLRRGRTTREAAHRAVRALASMRARLLGVVLNDVDAASAGVDYAGYYGYGPGGSRIAS